ncbi:MAG: TonB family protein [Bdellovibrio sp.]|nr:MAG: TonB family protein [Bdellovibrio sp.]
MKNGYLVLKNADQEVVRVFQWQARGAQYLIYRKDSHRLEFHSDLKDLDSRTYEVLGRYSLSEIKKHPVKGNGWTICWEKQITKVTESVPLEVEGLEEKQQFKNLLKYTALAHIVPVFVLLLTSFVVHQFFQKEEKAYVVKVIRQKTLKKRALSRPRPQTVSVSRKKIKRKRRKRVVKRKVVSHKPKRKRVITRRRFRKAPRHVVSQRVTSRRVNIQNLGVLGALKGVRSGKSRSQGVLLNKAGRGAGWARGKGATTSFSRVVEGKGLLSASVGRGRAIQVRGSGVSKGMAGAASGYGKTRLKGGSRGWSVSLEEEALVQGGLDRDQIDAVVRKNINQIRYCYEKGLQTNTHLNGRVAVRFIINPQGRVKTARVSYSSLRFPQVERCILSKLRKWTFPKPYGGVNVRVTYPFLLKKWQTVARGEL